MTSLPIFWAENDAFASLSGGAETQSHWAVGALGGQYEVTPLDILQPGSLAGVDLLLLAQPRILTPAENVALDDWVRSGGRVLVFADPKLVGESHLPLGDPRRPLDSAMLSPILGRWGLEMVFDPADGLRIVRLGTAEMGVAAAGSFRLRPADGSQCRLMLDGLAAQCRIGTGGAVLVADATLLEDPVGGEGSPVALGQLLGMTREASRENAGAAGS
ncbi:Gldg family protein [Parerythrobacter aurantius]|uniref:Gldg family protein n=1 Tax=Parerythrobacter aurantius TaxID=3127706 RepID=UPI00324FC43D